MKNIIAPALYSVSGSVIYAYVGASSLDRNDESERYGYG